MATLTREPPPAEAAPGSRVQAARARTAFTQAADEILAPSRIEGALLFLIAAGIYFWVGYETVINGGVVVFDALDRLTRAYMVWHNHPAKLAAIGFVFPPLTTLSFLPFTIIKPLATSLVALPLSSALFGGSMVVAMNRLLARCSMPALKRWLVLALFALNPMLLFYAGNGMSEVIYLSLLTVALCCFVAWFQTAQPRFLVIAGLAFSMLVLLRYSFGIWAFVIAVMMAIGLSRRGADNDETEGTVVTFLAPLVYALGVWILFNWLIVGDPLRWLSSTGAFAVNAPQAASAGHVGIAEVLARTGQLTLGVYALGIIVVPALVLTAIGKRDEMSWWLAILALTGIVVMGAGALLDHDLNALAMRNALPVLIVCVAGAGWLYRTLPSMRLLIWIVALAGLALTTAGSWRAMQRYPFQDQEQAFVRAIQGGSQDGSSSLGGFHVGTSSEQRMAAYVKGNVGSDSKILADNAQTFGVILLSGRPQQFFDRVDKGDHVFEQVVQRPYGRVRYMLMAKQVSGDLVRRRYPTPASRVAAGLTPVFETQRYLLLAVAGSDPRGQGAVTSNGAGGEGAGQVGGRASGSDGTPGVGASTP